MRVRLLVVASLLAALSFAEMLNLDLASGKSLQDLHCKCEDYACKCHKECFCKVIDKNIKQMQQAAPPNPGDGFVLLETAKESTGQYQKQSDFPSPDQTSAAQKGQRNPRLPRASALFRCGCDFGGMDVSLSRDQGLDCDCSMSKCTCEKKCSCTTQQVPLDALPPSFESLPGAFAAVDSHTHAEGTASATQDETDARTRILSEQKQQQDIMNRRSAQAEKLDRQHEQALREEKERQMKEQEVAERRRAEEEQHRQEEDRIRIAAVKAAELRQAEEARQMRLKQEAAARKKVEDAKRKVIEERQRIIDEQREMEEQSLGELSTDQPITKPSLKPKKKQKVKTRKVVHHGDDEVILQGRPTSISEATSPASSSSPESEDPVDAVDADDDGLGSMEIVS